MARLNINVPRYKPAKDTELNWDSFRKGLNILLRETELEKDELAKAENLMLVGKGVPTKRWGTSQYFLAAATGAVRSIGGFYKQDGTNELLAITDQGLLTKKSGTSYSLITGASWSSGAVIGMAQIANSMYISSDSRELVRYSSPTLVGFPTIATPAGVFATQISGASGTTDYSYRISAVSNVGETLASSAYILGNQPQDPTVGTIKVTWSAVSAATTVLSGYNVFGRRLGDERFLGFVDEPNTTFIDDGSSTPEELTYPPTADTTGGIKAKYIKRFQDRLIYAGVADDDSKVVISGREPFQERNDWSYGGGYISIEPNAGDPITGLEIFEDRIIVFKERSIWEVTISGQTIGNYFVVTPSAKLITKSHGCIAPESIQAVENDVFFLSRKGVYALGYEPNILSVLRTNEISAKIRPFFDTLTTSQLKKAVAFYDDFKYGLTFPGSNKTMVYDRERLAWMGPWTKDGNTFLVYYDSSGDKKLVYGDDETPDVILYDSGSKTDKGSAFTTSLITKKEDYGDWTIFKNIKTVFTLFRNISGTVNVEIRVQDRYGDITTVKSFSITSTSVTNTGWGSDLWGDTQWGDSENAGSAADINEVHRWSNLNTQARNVQILVNTTTGSSNYELLAVRSTAKPIGLGFLPSSERV